MQFHTSRALTFLLLSSSVLLSACTSQRALTSTALSVPPQSTSSGPIYYLPKSLITFSVKSGVPAAPTAKTVQDRTAALRLNYAGQRYSYDDSLKVTLTGQSLLDTVEFSAEDKTADIITNIVATIAEGLKAATGIPSFTPKGIISTFNYEADFDPFEKADVDAVNAALAAGKLKIRFPELSSGGETSSAAEKCSGSLCFRTHRTLILAVDNQDDKGIWTEIGRHSVEVVDKTTLGSVDVDRMSLVKAQSKVEFTDGVFKKMEITRPSQGLAASAIPLNVVKQIVAIPSELVQFKFDTSKKYKELYTQQQETLAAQQKLIEALAKAEKAPAPENTDNPIK